MKEKEYTKTTYEGQKLCWVIVAVTVSKDHNWTDDSRSWHSWT